MNSLYQLAPDHVLHLGTFSKTLIPALRLGYMVIPETMLDEARQETNTLIFGFGNLELEMIESGLQRLKKVMNLYREN